VRVRSARREAMEGLKKEQKDSRITEDDLTAYEKDVQKLTDDFTKKIEDTLVVKEADIMKV
jgi:ribosome recycling factor